MTSATLLDVCMHVRNGMSAKQDADSGGLPITRIETIADGSIDGSRTGFAGVSRASSEKWIMQRGDILFSHINSPAHVGKVAIYDGDPPELVHGMNLLCLRPNRRLVEPCWLLHLLRSRPFLNSLQPFINRAVNQASISIGNLNSIEFSLPSMGNQRRIAAILDHDDDLRAKRRQVLAHLDTLTQSIFHDMFGASYGNISMALADVVKWSSGKFLPAKNQRGGSFPVFGGNGVNGYHDEYTYEERRLVIGRVGAYCGAVHLTPPRAWVTDNALIATMKIDGMTLDYLLPALTLANLNQFAGVSGQPSISAGKIGHVQILIPPLAMQTEFADRTAQVDAQRSAIVAAHAADDELFASLQSRAFRGEL